MRKIEVPDTQVIGITLYFGIFIFLLNLNFLSGVLFYFGTALSFVLVGIYNAKKK